jgi:autophagy-related protein 11
MAQDHIHHILSLFAAQYKALSLAYQNLDHHLAPLREEWNTLSRTADERLKEQVELLESAPNDLAILPKVPIHPAFWSKRDSAGNVVSRGKDETKDKTLADYIHARKMEEVIDTCRASHGELKRVLRYHQLTLQMIYPSASEHWLNRWMNCYKWQRWRRIRRRRMPM